MSNFLHPMKTDTPRTDTQQWINRYPEYHEKATRYVSADFARELERENDRLREAARRLVCAGSTIYSFARGHAPDGALSDWEAAADSFSFLKLPVD